MLQDHPHAYGDKRHFITSCYGKLGSSPRVWGQVHRFATAGEVAGIIPTRMGTSLKSDLRWTENWDHPHAYGDKTIPNIVFAVQVGSSPRVWGQAFSMKYSLKTTGIIPTRMGTSSKILSHEAFKTDHPHAYGDKQAQGKICRFGTGSSPRVWGQEL